MVGKGFTIAMAIIAAAAFGDLLAHGTQAQSAAKGLSSLWTPSLQAASGQTIAKPGS